MRSALWGGLGLLGVGCVLDTDAKCDPGQSLWTGGERCVCAEGMAYTEEGCVPCGANEVGSPQGCVCVPGFARQSPLAPCIEIPEGIGAPCSTGADCLNPAYPSCQASPLGERYCTSLSCASDDDCSGGYACELGSSPTYCRRPPTGAYMPCASDADCAGTEATFCDLAVSFSCLVRDCSVEPDSCFSGSECCDLSLFSLPRLCIPEGQCTQ